MEQMRHELGEKLYDACQDGDLIAVKAIIRPSEASNPPAHPQIQSVMYVAAFKDHSHIVQYCLQHGATITPDIVKIIMINHSKNSYTYLLDGKLVDVDYYIPWFGDILFNAATHDDLEWAKLCLDHGADPNKNLVDEHMSILAAVAESGSVAMAELLINHGAKVRGSGAIVMAAEGGNPGMVKLLLAKGADVDEVGIEHPTDPRFKEDVGSALHKAVAGGNYQLAVLLVDEGANVSVKDAMERTPLDLANAAGNRAIEQLLKEHGAQ